LLRTTLISGTALIDYGDGNEEFLSVPLYQGDTEWTDSEGKTHSIDNGNAFRHTYAEPGTYQVRVRAGSAVNYFRLNDSLLKDLSGYVWPIDNPYLIEVSKIQSSTLQNLDFSFGGLVNAVVTTDFILDTPEVETMTMAFYRFGRNNLTHRWSFPAGMLSRITKPTALRGTFFGCGLRKVEAGFLDSFVNLTSVWELFKNSMLGAGYYQDVSPWGPYPNSAISGDDDFIPVSLFWKNKFLANISHAFNFIGDTGYGGLQSGYSSFLVLRRELFWNGKSVGNAHGTIIEAYYAFGKCNRILFEPNLFKHLPTIQRMGGMFTQTNYMTHTVAWATMVPMAASETTIVTEADANGIKTAPGKGLTFDLNLIFPETYPSVTCMSGAFTCAADGVDYGFNRPLDYRPANLPITVSQAFSGADFLAKFPNAGVGSSDDRDLMFLGQATGTDTEKRDGRHGVFHRLNQPDGRISDAPTLPSLLFNNAIAY